ncbi:hypothetical protein GCM10025783_14100 [Amnibacterium soli]|uniref:HD domain-containing protein n=1 Tax=Amnibacterium soli TaxID=1282736 RepID=A0ABP8Z1D3_9MICO
MTETRDAAPNTASLRRRVPRLFSRAQPVDAVDTLIRTVRVHHPKADTAVIERAYAAAEKAHRGQKRKSGEPYITHPVAVSQILAELGIGPRGVAAALLHDTVEDTDYTLDELRADFGDEVALLVDGVTKLDKLKYGDSAQAETVRKMVIAMSKDLRVLIIKLADRLHNARTWGFVPAESAQRKAKETLEIYAPLAHRLGIQTIKLELEDLSFAVLYPKLYLEIESLVRRRTPQREEFVAQVIDQVTDDLKSSRIKGRVVGRPKQYYSIYQKMIVRGREFDEIYDLTGIRILVDSVRTATPCWVRSTRAGRRCRVASRTTSRRRSSTCTSRCTRPCWAPRGARSRSRSARTRCTSGRSSASPRTGSTRSRSPAGPPAR